MTPKEIRYYTDYSDDFVETSHQNIKLPNDYQWIKNGIGARLLSALTYSAALILGGLYCKTVLHVSFKNKSALKKVRGGCFLYTNHTQPFGDVIIPALALFPKRIYTLASPANLGLKVIGKALPYLGALPVPDSISGIKKMSAAVSVRALQGNCIVVYPEAHVWEYYNGIRPFSDSSFTFPVKEGLPVYCMTAVYTEQRFFKRPKLTAYIDGPFSPDPLLTKKEQAAALCSAVKEKMTERSALGNCEYIKYEKRKA